MDKRNFMAAALGAAALPAWANGEAAKGRRGPALLTVTGLGVRANRGPFDPVRDQMMARQKLSFTAAHAFDFAALAALPLWAVYDADRFPDMAAKPVNQRFALCPWGLYHVDVQAG